MAGRDLGRGAARARGLVRILSADWVVPVEGPPIRDGAVAIGDDGRIAGVGPAGELGAGERFPDAVILPGFVNAHTHLEYATYAGFGDGLSFGPWIALHVERKARIDFEEMEAIARLGALECLRSGITTVGDCSFSGAAATACADLGLGAIVYLEVFGRIPRSRSGSSGIRERIAHALSDRVRLGVSPHAPYTCTLDLYARLRRARASDRDAPRRERGRDRVPAHGQRDVAGVRRDARTPARTTGIRALAEAGLLGPHVLAAHCVQADAEEIELLAANDVAVAHCPRSNGYLGCGVAPLRALREAGVRVSIATDSPASTPSFDMFDEMRAAIVGAQSARTATGRARRPRTPSSSQPSAAPARSGSMHEIGSLAPGKWADLTVLSLAATPHLPWEDPVTATVLGGSPEGVVATLVSGTTRYEKGGKTWLELIDVARNARGRLLLPASRP